MNFDSLLNPFFLDKKAKLACLISGGVDSMVLLDLLCRYRALHFFHLEALHFNFHLRGEESDRDEQFVRKEAAGRKIHLEVVDSPLKAGPGIQERAREVRRAASGTLARTKGWTHLALGHQADDQAETFLHRCLRGAGLRGLRGMDCESLLPGRVKLIRPLLPVSRETIKRWAETEGVSHVSDSTNDKDDYLRNRLRHHLLPRLKEAIPDFLKKVHETCLALSFANRVVEKEVEDYLSRTGGRIKTADYLSQPQEIRFRVLRAVVEKGGYKKQFERKHFEELESILARNRGFTREFGPAIFSHRKGFFSCGGRP